MIGATQSSEIMDEIARVTLYSGVITTDLKDIIVYNGQLLKMVQMNQHYILMDLILKMVRLISIH